MEKQNVGWKKNLSVEERKCRLENFPWQKRTCLECPEFPVMQDRKTVGKKALGPIGEKNGKKMVIWRKKVFCRLKKQNVGWKKNLSVEKKMWVGEFPKGHVRNVRNSL